MMILQPFIISLLLTFNIPFNISSDISNKNQLAEVTKQLLSLEGFPSKLQFFTCWSKEETIDLQKILFEYHLNAQTFKESSLHYNLPEHQIFIMDLNCQEALKIIKLATELNLFRHPFRWIVYGKASSLSEFYLPFNSRVFVIEEVSPGTLAVVAPYKYSQNTSQVVENRIGSWNRRFGFEFFNNLNVAKNRTDLNNIKLVVSYVFTNPSSLDHLYDGRFKTVDALSKVNYVLVNHLIEYVNATREVILQSTWGYKNATTGIYSGLAGDLQTERADIGGTPMFFTADRTEILDYIAATTPTYMKFIFRAPPLSYVTNVFTLPFDATVWHMSFIMIAVIGVCVYIIVCWEWKEKEFRKKIEEMSLALRPNIFDVVMLEVGAISQQGNDVEPKSVSGRIATFFTFIVLMFMYTSYSANIVALLQSTSDSIRTLEDLLNSRIKLGVEDIIYAHYYFENANEPIRKAIYEQKVAPKGQKPNFMTLEEGIRRMKEGSFAFHVELAKGYEVIGDMFQENEKCALKEITFIKLIEPWLPIQKNSPYKKLMTIGMRKLHECGIQRREVNRIYARKPVCHTKGSNFGSVGMIDCYSAFLIFGTGVGMAIALLLSEILLAQYLQRNDSKIVKMLNTEELTSDKMYVENYNNYVE